MIAFQTEGKLSGSLAEAADFLRSCSSTKPTQEHLQVVLSLVSCLRIAVDSGDKKPLRDMISTVSEWNAPIDDLLAAAQHVVQAELICSSYPSVSMHIREIAETVRESVGALLTNPRLCVAAR